VEALRERDAQTLQQVKILEHSREYMARGVERPQSGSRSFREVGPSGRSVEGTKGFLHDRAASRAFVGATASAVLETFESTG